MKHHFGDSLDRMGEYWTIIPNRERFAYSADVEIDNKDEIVALTLNKKQENKYWQQLFSCSNLEELTLHDPSKEQIASIKSVTQLKRIRITFFRSADIEFIGCLPDLEEVVLEYVSGFSDLTPLSKLKKLKSLHLENLRRVSDFNGLSGLDSLKYLHITGTLDWNQPINDFEFLKFLPSLEVFSLGFITNKTNFLAFLPLLDLKNLKKIRIGRSTFKTNEYAFLQAVLPHVEGCSWDLCWDYLENFEFLGKRAGFVKKNSPIAKQRCEEFVRAFDRMKEESIAIIEKHYSPHPLGCAE